MMESIPIYYNPSVICTIGQICMSSHDRGVSERGTNIYVFQESICGNINGGLGIRLEVI